VIVRDVDTIARPATQADLPDYYRLAREFVEALPITPIVGINDEGIVDFLARALDNEDVFVWLAEQNGEVIGICGAMRYPLYFNPAHTVVQELWWWLTPKARGGSAAKKLFRALEDWTAEKGASALFMIALDSQNGERVSQFYTRSGFQPMERIFVKGVQ
jgi:GNAT superfamily N-acetyltransferase